MTERSAGLFVPWKTLTRREVFSVPGRVTIFLEQVQLPDDRIIDEYVQIHARDFAIVFADTDDRRVICCRQYRHGIRGTSLELPAGGIEAGEAPLEAAQREFLEETGYRATDWALVGSFCQSANARSAEGHVYRARGAVRVQPPFSDDLEEVQVELLTRADLVAALQRGEIRAGATLSALALILLGS